MGDRGRAILGLALGGAVILGSLGRGSSVSTAGELPPGGRNILVLVDVSRSIDRASPEVLATYRAEPAKRMRRVLGDSTAGNRVWLAFFNHRITFFDPTAPRDGKIHVLELPSELRPPKTALSPEAAARTADDFPRALAGTPGDLLRRVAIQKREDLDYAIRLLEDPKTAVPLVGATDLVDAVFFATEFATSLKYSSVHMYTDGLHSMPELLAGRAPPATFPDYPTHFGYVRVDDRKQFEIRGTSVDQNKRLRDDALEYAKRRLNLRNQEDPLFAEFLWWRWENEQWGDGHEPIPPLRVYTLRAFPAEPELLLTSWETGEGINGIGRDRLDLQWKTGLRLHGVAGQDLISTDVPVTVESVVIDGIQLAQADPARAKALESIAFRTSGKSLMVGARVTREEPAQEVEVALPEMAAVRDPLAAAALLEPGSEGVPIRIRLHLDDAGLPKTLAKEPGASKAVWGDSARLGDPNLEIEGHLVIRELPDFEVVSHQSSGSDVPRAPAAALTVPVTLRWNRAAAALGKKLALAPLPPGPDGWAEVAFLTGAPGDWSQRDEYVSLPQGARSATFLVGIHGSHARAEATSLPLRFIWADGTEPKASHQVDVDVRCPPGQASVRADVANMQPLRMGQETAVAKVVVQKLDVNAAGGALSLFVTSSRGLTVRVEGAAAPEAASATGTSAPYGLTVPSAGEAVYRILVTPRLEALEEANLSLEWRPTAPDRATLAAGRWPETGTFPLRIETPALAFGVESAGMSKTGVPLVDLGRDLDDEKPIVAKAMISLSGIPAGDASTLDRLGEVQISMPAASGIQSVSLMPKGSEGVSRVPLSTMKPAAVPIEVRVTPGVRSLAGSRRIAALVHLTVPGKLGANGVSQEFYVVGYLAPRIPTVAWVGGGLALALMIILGFTAYLRRNGLQGSATGPGAASGYVPLPIADLDAPLPASTGGDTFPPSNWGGESPVASRSGFGASDMPASPAPSGDFPSPPTRPSGGEDLM